MTALQKGSTKLGSKNSGPMGHNPTAKHCPVLDGCRSVDRYQCLNKIDEGTYGVVFRAIDKQNGKVYALKQVKFGDTSEGFPVTSLREITVLMKLRHPGIVDVREIVGGPTLNHVFMVMEYMEHELKALLETMKTPFTLSEVKCLLRQLLEAVAFMHANYVLHRDLKTSNLLFNNRGELKICDFGLAREYGAPRKPYTKAVVTLWYRAPELLLGTANYASSIDVWSVGCIYGEILLTKPLFAGKSEIDQLAKIFDLTGSPDDGLFAYATPAMREALKFKLAEARWREVFSEDRLPDSGLALLEDLLECLPERRVSANEALQDRFFREAPRPQAPELMPSLPELNCKPRAQVTGKRKRSLDEAQLAQRNLFHAGATRFNTVPGMGV
jgi:cell division cycle 2-like protein